MRTVTETTTYYSFHELDDAGKKAALSTLGDINIDHDWWDYVYEDAERIGLKIHGFDLWSCEIKGKLIKDVGEICQSILTTHGKDCDTYKAVKEFYRRRQIGASMDEEEFIDHLLEVYRCRLASDYEYFMSDEAVIETIEVNEYEFKSDGSLI